MPQLALLRRPSVPLGRKIGMSVLRSYLAVATVLVAVKIVAARARALTAAPGRGRGHAGWLPGGAAGKARCESRSQARSVATGRSMALVPS